ncbi:DMT family transporter [Labrys monachus]|uniref:Drug/metabolite transporter (DMT)-like permease n=1 Tax=Labrys monachus TaxID=217067 RepID=A0ABU0FCA9_9HYPH|nr:DMT family transporter [Labrys monachus]MDQ0391743.1 drug/metabolite transporter (DMT)-like permease [Labrys monachus]
MTIERGVLPADSASAYRMGLLLVTLSAVAWSTAGYFTRAIPLDAGTILFWRGVFGAATGLVFIVAMERGATLRAFARIGWPGLSFCVLSSCGMISFLYALKLTSVAHVAIIYAAVPFVAAALAWTVLRERASPATLAASLAALAGVAVTVAGSGGEGGLAGDALALAMTCFMAAVMVVRRRSRDVPMVPAACLSAALTALASLPLASPWPVPWHDLAALALFGSTNMGLGLILFVIGAALIPAAQTALIGALETPLAPLWVWLAFGETPQPATLLGGAVVMAAVIGNIVAENGRPSNGERPGTRPGQAEIHERERP